MCLVHVADLLQHDGAPGIVTVIEIRVHHIGTGSAVLALTVHHHADQLTASLLLIVMEHLQREEVVGRGTDVCVEDDQWHARVLQCARRMLE